MNWTTLTINQYQFHIKLLNSLSKIGSHFLVHLFSYFIWFYCYTSHIFSSVEKPQTDIYYIGLTNLWKFWIHQGILPEGSKLDPYLKITCMRFDSSWVGVSSSFHHNFHHMMIGQHFDFAKFIIVEIGRNCCLYDGLGSARYYLLKKQVVTLKDFWS